MVLLAINTAIITAGIVVFLNCYPDFSRYTIACQSQTDCKGGR